MAPYIRLRPHWPDEPIVQALGDTDFYKFTMGQFIYFHYKNVQVTFGFKNRTIAVKLGHIIPEARLREELDHVRTLRFTNSELHYLRGTNEYSDRMFKEPYLEFLKTYQAPPYQLEYRGEYIILSFSGNWAESSPWEIHALEILGELYYRELLKTSTAFDKDVIYAEGKKRLWEKIQILKKNPQVTFSEFGTRRRFSRDWQDYVVGMLAEELPSTQFRGTSNMSLAMKYGLLPMGTNAHELQMVIAGLSQSTDEELRESQNKTLDQWWQQYGEPLAISLPDTFGTDAFIRLAREDFFKKWKGFRQDSGNPIAEGEQWIKAYQERSINHSEKLMVPSDGMELDPMLAIEKHFRGRLQVSFGWGTNLTNDLGLKPLSLVVKATSANGIGLVKLSNNPAKAMGDPEAVKRYMRVFGYGEHTETACKY
ncbi:MAG: nicotinate phosphoribosyltransferase [Candidatus Pacebacteria bacterium]|nr:nicotinate phosphoribosyltransferase [Candidatus Paceibacterota bacterium]